MKPTFFATPPAFRAWRAAILAMLAMLASGVCAGCATRFRRASLEPVATADVIARPYAQVRQVGAADLIQWWIWSDESSQVGATVEVRNGSSAPLTVDVAKTTLLFESVGTPDKVSAGAVAAGPGGLPARVDRKTAVPGQVALAPGEQRELWIVFERFKWPSNARITLRLAVNDAEPVLVTLRDPATGKSRWAFEPEGPRAGFHVGLEGRTFGTRGYALACGLGPWLSHRSFRLGIDGWLGPSYGRGAGGLDAGSGAGFGLDLAWHPLPWLVGLYGAGGFDFTDFSPQSGLPDKRWTPSASVGIEGGFSLLFFRLGYVHQFGDPAGRQDGFAFVIGKNVRYW
jgi:hypothetical protein